MGGRARALVTGASDGIGAGFARELARRGVDLVVTARRRERLEALAAELAVDTEVVAADLADPAGRQLIADRLRATQRPIDLLVANAGLGVYGPLATQDPGRVGQVLSVNVTALTELVHAALPGMQTRGRGALVLVGSTAGYVPGPFGAVYGATKAYVRSFSEALTEELRGTGVRVMLLAPGVTDTGFQAAAGVAADAVPAAARMSVEPVVRTALRDLARGRAVSVPGGLNKLAVYGGQVTPSWLTRRVSAVVHRRFAGH